MFLAEDVDRWLSGEAWLVAIKRIRPDIARDEEVLSIIFEEALRAQRLSHRNICALLELGHLESTHFLVMEHLPGRDLGQLRMRLRQMDLVAPIGAALFIAGEVCAGLDFAHRAGDGEGGSGVVHRCLVPGNVRLSSRGAVTITDFGIARAVGSLLQGRARILKRTSGYLAPEQVRAQEVDRRSDLFSLGVLLYELLTGSRAFGGENDIEILDRVRRGDLVWPTHLRPEVTVEVEQVVMKALASEPEERYQEAGAMRREILRCLTEVTGGFTVRDLADWLKTCFPEDLDA